MRDAHYLLELKSHGIHADQIITLNFEKMGLSELRDSRALHDWLLRRIKEIKGRAFLFLDEMQEVENWEACINSICVEADVDIYLTGSNAKMLAGEFATLLSGRYIQVTVYPFSFREFLVATLEHEPDITQAEAFGRYLRVGGMPFVCALSLSESDALQYLRNLFASVVIKDIMKCNNFRNADLLERIITYAMANIGGIISANSIANYFVNEKRRVAPDIVLNYLKACEEAFLLFNAERFDVPSKRLFKVDEKFYVTDHGLREAVYGNNARDIERVLENIVCIEMLRRGYKVMVGRVGTREIDFICKLPGTRIYVQVCYLLASDETIEREFGVFAKVPDNYPKYVVILDEIDLSRDGVIHRNIRDFLLASGY